MHLSGRAQPTHLLSSSQHDCEAALPTSCMMYIHRPRPVTVNNEKSLFRLAGGTFVRAVLSDPKCRAFW